MSAFSGVNAVFAQQAESNANPTAPVKLSEIPERLFQVQDDLGFFWQSFGNGALLSGEAQYLQSGLNLIVDGEPLKPSEVFAREPAPGADRIDLQFIEKRADTGITRDLWFDQARSGVRVFDTVSNFSTAEKVISVSLRTTYPFSWQSLHGTGAALLSGNPVLQLNPGDSSLCVHFNRAEGRHDTFFVLGSEKGGLKPELKASPNYRELTFVYTLAIPPGESRSLMHWIMQRNQIDLSDNLSVISPFFQRGKLIEPGLEPAAVPGVANFSQSSFQSEPAATAQLKSLLALNGLMDHFGSHRRGEDLLWISATNQVSGVVKREGVLTVDTSIEGQQEIKITDIAAIRGSSGIRRNSLIYLRNGRVLSGEVTKGEISWSVGVAPGSAAAPAEILGPNALNMLFLSTESSDGVPPPKASHFMQLTTGSVIPLNSSVGSILRCSTPWGARQFSLSEILEIAHTVSPQPHFRVILKSGASLTAFPSGGSVSFESATGEKVEVDASLIDRIWTAGSLKLLADLFSETWLDFSELPFGVGPAEGFLLAGNTLLDGGFADEALEMRDGEADLTVETAQIKTMKRSLEPGSEHRLEIELLNGEKIVGEMTANEVRLSSDGGDVVVPADRIFAYRGKES